MLRLQDLLEKAVDLGTQYNYMYMHVHRLCTPKFLDLNVMFVNPS